MIEYGDNSGALKIKTIIILALLGIFMIFILQNTTVVEIRFLFWQLSLSRVILLIGSLVIGILIGLLIRWESSVASKRAKDSSAGSSSER